MHSGSVLIARSPMTFAAPERRPAIMGASLADLARAYDVNPLRAPVVCNVDGKWVLQRDWAATVPSLKSVVQFVSVPRGGGSNTLRSALLIALSVAAIIAAPYAAPAIAGAIGTTLAVSSAIAQAAIVAAGTVLINALVPAEAARDYGKASPTYSIGSQGNTARLGAPIPAVYGRCRWFPDFVAPPYTYYASQKQYLVALMCLGQGEFDIEQINFDDAPADQFREIETEVLDPGETLTLIDPYVWTAAEVQGQQLRAPNDTGDWLGYFPAFPAGQAGVEIEIDLELPGGLMLFSEDGDTLFQTVNWRLEAYRVDDTGAPIGDGSAEYAANHFYTNSTLNALRYTTRITMPSSGRWAARIKRTSNKGASDRIHDDIHWTGLKGITTGPTAFTGVTMLAIKVRASDQVTGQIARRINVVATRKLSAWNGSAWGAVAPTRNPAWALADVLRNSDYGAGISDVRLDPDELLELATTWDGRDDYFDRVFDTSGTVWDALVSIARSGRATPYQQSGVVRVYRDGRYDFPTALFTPQNIVSGSFSLTCVMHVDGETADGVEVDYLDNATWQMKTLTIGVDGATPDRPARETLTGVTDAAQAQREAEYMAVANRYRRAFVSFRTELEGLLPSPGDLVLLAHDIGRWTITGRVEQWTPATKTLVLAEEVTLGAGPYYASFRGPRGEPSIMIQIVSQADSRTLVLAAIPTLYDGGAFDMRPAVDYPDREPTHYTIGADRYPDLGPVEAQLPAQTPFATSDIAEVPTDQVNLDAPRPARVVSCIPRGDSVEILVVLDDSRVYIN